VVQKDFTSALYLGMHHGSRSLEPWEKFTTGLPAAFSEPRVAVRLAHSLATLQGCERATLAPSTLHLFWDLFGMLSEGSVAIYTDSGVYPIARWGIERAAARGVPVRGFRHHDPAALRAALRRGAAGRARPVVVTDGFCPACGRPAPLADYLRAVREWGGLLVIDDTQAAGIFGHSPGSDAPYGRGGGGMLRWHDISDPHALLVSSLAKGFGVPLTVLAGGGAFVSAYEEQSQTRVHCSPPSFATLHALQHALQVNAERGDALRLRLARMVRHFRRRLAEVGLSAEGNLFPVQTLVAPAGLDAETLHERLQEMGTRTVLHRPRADQGARLSFMLTAAHTPADIDAAVGALASLTRPASVANTPEATHGLRTEF
jgi:8-amino-7-oxononanoate synthase